MIRHELIIQNTFPDRNSRKGEPTEFRSKIMGGQKTYEVKGQWHKWESKINDVVNRKAVLALKEWAGRPYHSDLILIKELTFMDGVGIEKLDAGFRGWNVNDKESELPTDRLARGNGMTSDEFNEWFKEALKTNMCIIHFSEFRYDLEKALIGQAAFF